MAFIKHTEAELHDYIFNLFKDGGMLLNQIPHFTNNLMSHLKAMQIGETFNQNDWIIKKEVDHFLVNISTFIKEDVKEIIESEEEYKFYLYGRKSRGNFKQIDIKELKRSYATAAIQLEIYEFLNKKSNCIDQKGTVANLVNSMILGDNICYITQSKKILFCKDESLYLTERYENPFAFKTKEAEEMVQDTDLIFMIMGVKHSRKEITLVNIEDYICWNEFTIGEI
jgi:hypothetical protein